MRLLAALPSLWRASRHQGPDAELLNPSSEEYVTMRANIYSIVRMFFYQSLRPELLNLVTQV